MATQRPSNSSLYFPVCRQVKSILQLSSLYRSPRTWSAMSSKSFAAALLSSSSHNGDCRNRNVKSLSVEREVKTASQLIFPIQRGNPRRILHPPKWSMWLRILFWWWIWILGLKVLYPAPGPAWVPQSRQWAGMGWVLKCALAFQDNQQKPISQHLLRQDVVRTEKILKTTFVFRC